MPIDDVLERSIDLELPSTSRIAAPKSLPVRHDTSAAATASRNSSALDPPQAVSSSHPALARALDDAVGVKEHPVELHGSAAYAALIAPLASARSAQDRVCRARLVRRRSGTKSMSPRSCCTTAGRDPCPLLDQLETGVRLSPSGHRVHAWKKRGWTTCGSLRPSRSAIEHTQDEALFDEPGTSASASAPLALYRRYRPDTFAEVIGQDHVTEPLQRALTNNRVNHAYLFSGPRGCGKTTSARILARALNCEKGPRAVPCGECQSCRDLARNGPGSIDVIEIDAASHGGVDDARDLRERAFFAPVSSRFKIYIVDEAHMVTTAGFNALLKLVEEPPPHVKFVFATTEPDKVISTIRSRTHHYPFRLVPPRLLTEYLGQAL